MCQVLGVWVRVCWMGGRGCVRVWVRGWAWVNVCEGLRWGLAITCGKRPPLFTLIHANRALPSQESVVLDPFWERAHFEFATYLDQLYRDAKARQVLAGPLV